jgi:hypothetical protein
MDTLFSVLLVNFAVTLAWLGGLFLVVRHYHRVRIEMIEHDRAFDAQEAERRREHHAKCEHERQAVLERMFHAAVPIILEAFRVIDKSTSTGGGSVDEPDSADDASYSPCTTKCCDGVVS